MCTIIIIVIQYMINLTIFFKIIYFIKQTINANIYEFLFSSNFNFSYFFQFNYLWYNLNKCLYGGKSLCLSL